MKSRHMMNATNNRTPRVAVVTITRTNTDPATTIMRPHTPTSIARNTSLRTRTIHKREHARRGGMAGMVEG